MNDLPQLVADCGAGEVRLSFAGEDELRIDAAPKALTSDLMERLKLHKAELLKMLRPDTEMDLTDATAVWQAALDELDFDPEFPRGLLSAVREADDSIRLAGPSATFPANTRDFSKSKIHLVRPTGARGDGNSRVVRLSESANDNPAELLARVLRRIDGHPPAGCGESAQLRASLAYGFLKVV